MTTYEPGWYLATVDGVPDQRVSHMADGRWLVADGQRCVVRSPDFRPAIVLDPNDTDVRFIAALSVHPEPFSLTSSLGRLAELIASQMREPKPARISEPGPWAVVEATTKGHTAPVRWVRHTDGTWFTAELSGWHRSWDDLADPVLIREGDPS